MWGRSMKRSNTRLLLRLSLLPVALAVACVSSGKYDGVKAQRDALETENARLEKRVQQLEASMGSLESPSVIGDKTSCSSYSKAFPEPM